VGKLNKSSISEVKAYKKPPELVLLTLEGVMILFNLKPEWTVALKKISEVDFLSQIKNYNKDNVSQKIVNKLRKYCKNPKFDPAAVRRQSVAASALCIWCHAIYTYSTVFKEVAPKRAALKKATKSLEIKQESLRKVGR